MGKIAKMVLVLVLCGLCLSTFAFGAGHGKNGKMLIGLHGLRPDADLFLQHRAGR